MSQRPGRSAVPPTALVATLALLAPLLAALTLSTPAHAAGSVKLTVAGTPVAGQKTKLTATVKPKAKGRTVVFSVKHGKKWKKLGTAKTKRSGKATLNTKKLKAGKQTLRVVASKHKGQKQQTRTKKITVKKNGTTTVPTDTGNRVGDHHQIIAPERTATGSTFEMTIEVNTKRALTGAQLTLTAPTKGSQITPPDDVRLTNGKATVDLGDIKEDTPTQVTLRWKAPASPTTLSVKARLTASGGVTDTTDAKILVVNDHPDSAPMDRANLKIFTGGIHLPSDPEQLNASCDPVSSGAVPTFKTALTRAKTWVQTQLVPGQGDWTKDPAYDDPEALLEAFAAAHADDRPGAMMAFALRGHELAPDDARHLTNAGLTANMLERPGWAIAFLLAAAGKPVAPGHGMPHDAIRLNNLGNAHALRADWAQAVALTQEALAVDPENPLLHRQLATLLVCAGRKEEALEHLRQAYRDDAHTPDEVESEALELTWPDADRIYDMTPGNAGKLELMRLPVSFETLIGLNGQNGLLGVELAKIKTARDELRNREWVLRPRWMQALMTEQPAVARRQRALVASAGRPDATREVHDAYQAMMEAAGEWRDTCFDTMRTHPWCNVDSAAKDFSCAQHNQLFLFWRARGNAYLDAVLNFHAVAQPVWTGVQGNISDPIAHELAGIAIKNVWLLHMDSLVSGVAEASQRFGTFNRSAVDLPTSEATCTVPTPPDPSDRYTNKDSGEDAAACSDAIKPWGLSVDIKVAKLKVTCEAFSIEATSGKLLQGFAKLEAGFNAEGFTKATTSLGSKLGALGYSFESAIYVEFDSMGQVSDFGWVMGQEFEPSAGPVSLKTFDDKVKISFMNWYEGYLL